jgi:hypothetical protein
MRRVAHGVVFSTPELAVTLVACYAGSPRSVAPGSEARGSEGGERSGPVVYQKGPHLFTPSPYGDSPADDSPHELHPAGPFGDVIVDEIDKSEPRRSRTAPFPSLSRSPLGCPRSHSLKES